MTDKKPTKKCDGYRCKIKNLCKRYKMKINPFNQSWIEGGYAEEDGCTLFINNKEDIGKK